MTMSRPGYPRDWSQQIRILREALDFLLATSDRSDPVEETVLSIVESALHAVTAARRLRWDPAGVEARAALLEMLAAARAAVVAASFATVQDGASLAPVTGLRAVANRK